MYHNTTNENSIEASQMTVNNAKQEEVVITIFATHKQLTPTQAHNFYKAITGKYKTPLTSIRRAISDLTNQGRLEQTAIKSIGVYGKSEYNWIFKSLHTRETDIERQQSTKVSKADKASAEAKRAESKKALITKFHDMYNNVDKMDLLEIKQELLLMRVLISEI